MRRAAVSALAVVLGLAGAANAQVGGEEMTVDEAVPDDMPLEHVIVLLGLRAPAALDAVLAAQQDPRSSRFHRWLEPTEIADRFGPSRAEYARVREWFAARGFRVVHDSPLRVALAVAGTAGDVATALATPIRFLRENLPRTGRLRRADLGLLRGSRARVRLLLGSQPGASGRDTGGDPCFRGARPQAGTPLFVVGWPRGSR